MAGEALPKPKAKPDNDLTQHPAYDLGLRHAFSGIAKNPFSEGGSLLDEAAPGGASATLPRKPNPVAAVPSVPAAAKAPDTGGRIYPSVPTSTTTTTSPATSDIVGETNRRSSLPSSDPQSLSPFRTGFFKPASDRNQDRVNDQNARVASGRSLVRSVLANQGRDEGGNYLNSLPRAPGPEPAVGGERAILPPPGNGVKPYMPPGTTASTTFDASKGTRKPFIGGANGENVAGDFVAGGRFSSAKAGNDDTLDKDYVAGLPRTRNQRAVTTQPRKAFFSGG